MILLATVKHLNGAKSTNGDLGKASAVVSTILEKWLITCRDRHLSVGAIQTIGLKHHLHITESQMEVIATSSQS